MKRMTDKRLAEIETCQLSYDLGDAEIELLQAMKAERAELEDFQKYGSALSKEICGQNIQINGLKEQIKLLEKPVS